MMYFRQLVIVASMALVNLGTYLKATAQQPAILVSDLNRPVAIAIAPASGQVLIAENGPARLIRWADGKRETVVDGFEDNAEGPQRGAKTEIRAMACLDDEHLAVACQNVATGTEELRIYRIPKPGKPPIRSNDVVGDRYVVPVVAETEKSQIAGLVAGSQGLFVLRTITGGGSRIALAKFTAEHELLAWDLDQISEPNRTAAGFAAIGINPEGHLTIAQTALSGPAGDHLLFYSESGARLASLDAGLASIVGIGFGPRRGRLFAISQFGSDAQSVGLYKLVGTGNHGPCLAKLVAPLESPRCMAFHPEGDLFIILDGARADGATPPSGMLIQIQGLDVEPDQ